ncbi:winged helix-turn-helix domain-containing protein [Dokdonella ginsengisoli]|uniref:Winged helix-turn-helix domain-containing protein n=1 Tax=Dokdonella ginsengisoli TaxID=363846 RepID=A0ABV9QU45_9GAMM
MGPCIYRFFDCSVDVAARELRRSGERVALSPTVFDCLVYLIEHRGRAVGHDELVAAVLGKVDVGDTVLRQMVRRLRQAVGDAGNQQRVLRTVAGFGYQFIAELTVDGGAEPTAAASPVLAPPTPAAPARRIGWMASALALLTLLAGAAAVLHSGRERRSDPPLPPVPAAATTDAAVLPVETAAAEQWAWVRLGLMDLIASRLHAGGLTVVPTESIVALPRDRPAAEMASAVRKLSPTRYLILPSAEHNEREWIVRLRLDADDGNHREVEARDADVTRAGQLAVDQVLILLGRPPSARAGEQVSLDERTARIRAAILTQNLDTARKLIEDAPVELQRTPELRYSAAAIEYGSGHLDTAYRALESLAKDVSAESDPVLRGRLMNAMALISTDLGEAARAVDHADEAIDLLGGQREPLLLGRAHNTRGIAYSSMGRYDESSADYAQARLALTIAGDARGLVTVDLNEGILAVLRNQPAAALPLLESASRRVELLTDLTGLALAASYMTEVHLLLLDPVQALAAYDHATLKLEGLHDPVTRNNLDYAGAVALQANGRLAEARGKFDALVRSADVANGNALKPLVRSHQAKFELGLGRSQSALNFAREAIDAIQSPSDGRVRADAWLTATRAQRDLHGGAEADAEVKRFSAWADTQNNPVVALHARLAEAERAWSRNPREAIPIYDAALRQALQLGMPAYVAMVVNSYANGLLGEGDLNAASTVIGQIARWGDRDFDCALTLARFYLAAGKQDAWKKALQHARALAGERPIPIALATPPDDNPRLGSRQP